MRVTDTIYLGPVPPEEGCVQLGAPDYSILAEEECERYIALIRSAMGPEPEGARLRVKWSDHDYGRYAEVVCEFDEAVDAAREYALRCDWEGPVSWEDSHAR